MSWKIASLWFAIALLATTPASMLKAATNAAAAAIVQHYLKRPAEELYDLKHDPYEINNLATKPEQGPRIAQFRTELNDWMKANGDEGLPTEKAHKPAQKAGAKKKAAAKKN